MLRLPRSPRIAPRWRAPAVLGGLMIALQAGGAPVRDILRYERSAVLGGELWRLVTAHLVHLGWVHCLLNLAALALCAAFARDTLGWRAWAGATSALALGVGVLLLALSPQVASYVGLSGVLYGLFVCVLAPQAQRGDRFALIALLCVLGRAGWQLLAEPVGAQVELIGGTVVAQAHVYGAVCAAALLAARAWRARIGAIA